MRSATPAQPDPPSSADSSSHQIAQNDLQPALRDQIPIAGQLLSHCPAGSFFGDFPTPAPLIPDRPLAPGRHPKPFPKAVICTRCIELVESTLI